MLLVDGGLQERYADLMQLMAERWPGLDVETLFHTHRRPEHTGANAALAATCTRIIAHEHRAVAGGDFFVEWENQRVHPAVEEALPTETF